MSEEIRYIKRFPSKGDKPKGKGLCWVEIKKGVIPFEDARYYSEDVGGWQLEDGEEVFSFLEEDTSKVDNDCEAIIVNMEELAKKAFSAFRYRPFPHNNPTWEEWKESNPLPVIKITLPQLNIVHDCGKKEETMGFYNGFIHYRYQLKKLNPHIFFDDQQNPNEQDLSKNESEEKKCED